MFLVWFQSSQRMLDESSENVDFHQAGTWRTRCELFFFKGVQLKINYKLVSTSGFGVCI